MVKHRFFSSLLFSVVFEIGIALKFDVSFYFHFSVTTFFYYHTNIYQMHISWKTQRRVTLIAPLVIFGLLLYLILGDGPIFSRVLYSSNVSSSTAANPNLNSDARIKQNALKYERDLSHWWSRGETVRPLALQGDHIVHYDLNALTHTPNPLFNEEHILILTDMENFNPKYWENLLALQFPKNLIDLGIVVPRSRKGDKILKQLETAIRTYEKKATNENKKFRHISIIRLENEDITPRQLNKLKNVDPKLALKSKLSEMALKKNNLLLSTIAPDISWILWLDGGIIETPPTLIQDLAMHNKSVISPNTYQRIINDQGKMDISPYDMMNWVESSQGLKIAALLDDEDILTEESTTGQDDLATYRALMVFYYDKDGDINVEMQLDSVGRNCILVNADVHRDGAMFPTFPFYHLIESEGFGKVAKRLGYDVFGLPNYLVYHEADKTINK